MPTVLREFHLPQERDLFRFSQSLYKACDIFPQASSYHASPVSPPMRKVLSLPLAERKPLAFSNFLPPTVKG